MNPASIPIGKIKALVFVAALGPLGRLAYAAYTGDFGPNPVEFLQRYTGTWTFNFLLLTLCISPLRALTGLHWLLRLRRMLGLFSFFYACLHFLSFIGFDHAFDPGEIARDVIKRPFVTVGFAAFVLLIPLAATSNALAIRRLGGRRWQDLHRAVYLIALLAVVHYFWLVKATALIYPIVYGLLVAVLLGWRIRDRLRRNGPYPATAGISVRRSG
ncbi:MAG: sulfoxide reductase heme-binding subunit YedZ [Dechloromonas sp.]|jgi:sulfoxide reductase heme-binding subunit YedZ|nr:sulfoxide reductase heme-binding subunit YedZ [Dechloromonas sp.]